MARPAAATATACRPADPSVRIARRRRERRGGHRLRRRLPRPRTADAGRGRAAGQRDAHDGVGVERAAASRWIGSTEATCARSALRAGGCAAPRVDAGVEGGSICRWLPHGSVDAAACWPAHRAALWARVQREPGVAHPRLAGLLMPTTLGASARARRDRDQAMEADTLAGSKKTPQNKAESSSS